MGGSFTKNTVGMQPFRRRYREDGRVNDLPGEKPRLIERATGVQHTIVGGNIVFSDNVHQGGLPGTLLQPL